jgi:hypothetical protein
MTRLYAEARVREEARANEIPTPNASQPRLRRREDGDKPFVFRSVETTTRANLTWVALSVPARPSSTRLARVEPLSQPRRGL